MTDLQKCKGECGKELPLNEENFYFNKTYDSFFTKCIPCYSKERREYVYKKEYEVSPEEVKKMYDKQEGKCLISGVHETELDGILNVDHCHETGYVRGLICGKLNRGLGLFNHSIKLMISGVVYLIISKVKIQWKLLSGTLKKRNK